MIHICLATDNNYVDYTMMCIYDIMIRQDPTTEITFHILTDRLSFEQSSRLSKIANIPHATFDFISVDTSSILPEGDARNDHHTTTAFARIMIPELLKNKGIDKVIYLDSDMICRKDLTELYNTNLKGRPLGMVKECAYLAFTDVITIPWNKARINAGLIIMDIPKLVELGFTNTLIEAIEFTECDIAALLDHEMFEQTLLLPPTYQIPMNHFVANKFNIRQFCQLNYWNMYHGTNYETFDELFAGTYFWHFENKKEDYMSSKLVKAIYDLSQQRLEAFLDTNTVMNWKPEDDSEIETRCYDRVHDVVNANACEQAAALEDVRRRRDAVAPDVTDWKLYFDRIYCFHTFSKPNRLCAAYHEMRRVGMEKTNIMHYFNTTPSKFDADIYAASEHTLFDQTVDEDKRMAKVNQIMGYYQLFRELVGSGVNRVLICEDDVLFLTSCMSIRTIMDHMPELWDYIKFERVNGPSGLIDRYGTVQERDYFHRNYTGGYLGSACCAYSRTAMQLAIKVIEEQLVRPDYLLENRDDERLDSLRRFVAAENMVIEAGRSINSAYRGIAKSDNYWSDWEYRQAAQGGEI